MKDRRVFVVATANNVRKLPGSLTRAGRFDHVLKLDCPEGQDAEDIVALIVCTTWRNRLFPGEIKTYLQKGVLIKWLERLDELDK